MNVFCSDLIIMVSEWNYFIFMPIDFPRWPPGTVTQSSINTKITIFQDPLVEIDPTLFQNVSCINPLYFFCSLRFLFVTSHEKHRVSVHISDMFNSLNSLDYR